MRRRNHSIFTEKKHSKRGVLSCILTAVSVGILLYTFYESFLQRGEGSIYLGCAGVLALAVSMAAFYHAVKSLWEEDSSKTIPVFATVFSVAAAGIWIAIYVTGFFA